VGGRIIGPNLRYYHGICLGRLRKTLKNIRMVGVPEDIYNCHLANTSRKHYNCANFVCILISKFLSLLVHFMSYIYYLVSVGRANANN
jgi:hypothetical protein